MLDWCIVDLQVVTCCDHLGLGGGKLRKHEPRAVAQHQALSDVERLKMLGLAGRSCNSGLLGPEQRVDGGGLAHIGVAC